MPEVTIYMPTRNRAPLLMRAISSVINQSFQDWELIIVDDSSTDNTAALLERIADFDRRIRVFRQRKPLGGCAARNVAIDNAAGRFITGLDDDDMFLPSRLSDLLGPARDGARIVCAYDLFWSGHHQRRITRPRVITYPMQVTRNYAGNQLLTCSEYLKEIGGFDVGLPALQDYDVWNRLIKRYGNAVTVASYNHVIHGSSSVERISTNKEKKIEGFKKFYEKHCDDMSFKDKHLHVARRKVLTSRSSAIVHALIGSDINIYGFKEFWRLALVNPLR